MALKKLRYILRKIRKGHSASSEDLVAHLRERGARIGEDVVFYSTSGTVVDGTAPWLLTIGNHVRITEGVRILVHDYSWSVLKHYSEDGILPGSVLGAQSPVEIGNCVFIGMNSVITRGVRIGDHVIIGAGSVVTRDCPSGGVYAGNPARRIMSIEEYFHKRQSLQFAEAKEQVLCYRERLGRLPPKAVMAEYFMLFSTREEAEKEPAFRKKMELLGNFDETAAYMDSNPPMFATWEAFLEACTD